VNAKFRRQLHRADPFPIAVCFAHSDSCACIKVCCSLQQPQPNYYRPQTPTFVGGRPRIHAFVVGFIQRPLVQYQPQRKGARKFWRSKVQEQIKVQAADTSALTNIKSNLDLAWVKIQDGLQREAEGRKLWVEGTLELIQILDKARGDFASDQEFGRWLKQKGPPINEMDRKAYLNMALNMDLTRKILEQTERRSPQLIWREEIQPKLVSANQPAVTNGKTIEEEPVVEKPTRRPRRARGAKKEASGERKPEWLRNIEGWFNNQVATVNAVTNELNKIMEDCKPEQRSLLGTLEPTLLLDASQSLEKKSAEFVDWVDTPLEKAADALSSRAVVTPSPKRSRRASKPVQPEA